MVKSNKKTAKKTIKLGEDIVAAKVEKLKEQLVTILNEGAKEIILDIKGIEVIDSFGLGLIIATHNSLKEFGGTLKIKNASEKIFILFQTLRLDKQLEVTMPG
jgi:anti-anti-sigma factor